MMTNIALGLLIMLAVILLIAIIGVLGLWLKGVDSIAFPGLGLLISTGFILAALIIIETLIVILAAYIIRSIPVLR